jgi:hypothetical protein
MRFNILAINPLVVKPNVVPIKLDWNISSFDKFKTSITKQSFRVPWIATVRSECFYYYYYMFRPLRAIFRWNIYIYIYIWGLSVK